MGVPIISSSHFLVALKLLLYEGKEHCIAFLQIIYCTDVVVDNAADADLAGKCPNNFGSMIFSRESAKCEAVSSVCTCAYVKLSSVCD